MKSITFFYPIFLLFVQHLAAQITPIQTNTEGGFTIYKTSLHDQYSEEIKNQPYVLKRKISDINTKAKYRSGNGFDIASFQQLFSETNYNFLRNNRSIQSRFSVEYNIDATGNALSCSLYFPNNTVHLSDSEIEAILIEAMKHKFDYVKKPAEVSDFYFMVKYDFIL